jgi:hypothetical protein
MRTHACPKGLSVSLGNALIKRRHHLTYAKPRLPNVAPRLANSSNQTSSRSKTIGELIDDVERIGEDLFRLQQGLEKMESLQNVVSTDELKEA